MTEPSVERAVALLGPLEGRIMRAVWTGLIPEPFVVRSVQQRMPELAYTTLMTTLNRLAEKGLLKVTQVAGQRAYEYRAAGTAEAYLYRAGRNQVDRLLERYGDAALAAFEARRSRLSPAQRERLRRLADGD